MVMVNVIVGCVVVVVVLVAVLCCVFMAHVTSHRLVFGAEGQMFPVRGCLAGEVMVNSSNIFPTMHDIVTPLLATSHCSSTTVSRSDSRSESVTYSMVRPSVIVCLHV